MEPDPEDFTTLYKRSYRTILRYIYQRVNDHALAEDLTAETYARALEKQKNGVTITVGWLIRAARNLLLPLKADAAGLSARCRSGQECQSAGARIESWGYCPVSRVAPPPCWADDLQGGLLDSTIVE